MRERVPDEPAAGSSPDDQPLIGIPWDENGRESVRYFTSETEADAALTPETLADTLSLAGAWSDLPWDEVEAALDRIRHESSPSPPIPL